MLGKKPVPHNAELELVRRVTSVDDTPQRSEAQAYFVDGFSCVMLTEVARVVCHTTREDILGEYYEFISKPNFDTGVPFYKVSLYAHVNQATLISYVSVITTRYFTDAEKKKTKMEQATVHIDEHDSISGKLSDLDVIENPWFALLIDDRTECYDQQLVNDLVTALGRLPYREQLILQLTVADNLTGLEAYEELLPYIPQKERTLKQKQDIVSLLKGRALSHLKDIMKKIGQS